MLFCVFFGLGCCFGRPQRHFQDRVQDLVSCSERFFFVDMVCQVLSVSIVTGSDFVFVYRCENLVIIGFIIVYVY